MNENNTCERHRKVWTARLMADVNPRDRSSEVWTCILTFSVMALYCCCGLGVIFRLHSILRPSRTDKRHMSALFSIFRMEESSGLWIYTISRPVWVCECSLGHRGINNNPNLICKLYTYRAVEPVCCFLSIYLAVDILTVPVSTSVTTSSWNPCKLDRAWRMAENDGSVYACRCGK